MSLANTVLIAVGGILAFIYVLIIIVSGNKYDYMIKPLDKQEYRFAEIYTFGFAVARLINYKFTSKSELQRRKYISVLKGEKYAEYYLQVEFAKRVSLSGLFIVLSFPFAALADEPVICLLFIVIAVALGIRMAQKPQKMIEERSEMLLSDFADVVSKLALLINCGMIMRQAWEKVAYSKEGVIYSEMRNVVINLRDGMSESEAYFQFGNNCVIPEIKKFTSTIVQGIIKGNSELATMLVEQSHEVCEMKMNYVKRQGDAAVTKLVGPMMVMFIGILIMIMVPIFTGM